MANPALNAGNLHRFYRHSCAENHHPRLFYVDGLLETAHLEMEQAGWAESAAQLKVARYRLGAAQDKLAEG